MLETVEIQIGQTFLVDGKEYIIYSHQHTIDMLGRQANIFAMDPLRAMQWLEEQKQKRIILENQVQLKDLLPKMDKCLDEAAS